MDRGRRNSEGLARTELLTPRRRPQQKPVLAHAAGDNGHRGGRVVVIVIAGVLVLAPADDPGVHVLLIPDLLVYALVAGVADEMRPPLGGPRQRRGESLEFFRSQAHGNKHI